MINLSNLNSPEITLIWVSVFSISILLFALTALWKSHNKIDRIREEESERWKDLEMRAQSDYQQIINTANKKAQEILLQAIQIKRDSSNDFQSSVDDILENQKSALLTTSKDASQTYKETIEKVNQEAINMLSNIYKEIEKESQSKFAKYTQILEQQTISAEKIAEERIKEEYRKMEIDVEGEKKRRYEELEKKIYEVVQLVSKSVISRSLNQSDHDDLIIEALEAAKKEGKI